MRWKKRKPRPRPRQGDTREIEKFLWRPMLIDDEWRWLERVRYKQEFGRPGKWYTVLMWHDVEWIEIIEVPL